jgi:imidazolonepropionase-like amidohydrolase
VIVSDALRALKEGKQPDDLAVFRIPLTRDLIESFSADRERARIAELLATRTWVVPTLISLPVRTALGDKALRFTSEERWYLAQLTQLQMRLVRDMQGAGVSLMAGTDRPLQPTALAEELALLVRAGLTPLQALQSATIAPARFLAATDSLGTIAVGRLADLVLLNGNPLTNIAALSSVSAVITNGRLLKLTTGAPASPFIKTPE